MIDESLGRVEADGIEFVNLGDRLLVRDLESEDHVVIPEDELEDVARALEVALDA